MKRTRLDYLSVKCWNIHGLFKQINGCRYSKLDDPNFWTKIENVHIFSLIETWHTKNDVNELEIAGYKCYNICRPRNSDTKGRPSGGIAVYIKDSIRDGVAKCTSQSTENIFLKLKKDFFGLNRNIILGAAYCAPNKSTYLKRLQIDPYEDLENQMCDLSTEGDFLLLADARLD